MAGAKSGVLELKNKEAKHRAELLNLKKRIKAEEQKELKVKIDRLGRLALKYGLNEMSDDDLELSFMKIAEDNIARSSTPVNQI
ncbi:hypothetical protein [Iodobacter fluviatilis]|uniref:TraC-like protein n=1 Tax=Iodobacter fluviatilis TaxID=537 RepID=A0A377Q5M9_9NEIS|nr:hypothetical protein [Iodobacter fluviatilis]TCU84603.1 TraC-like protein [Iodobacter fluviatilis]STQ90068.1 Uncharacterised protein [Iodobacter fluviatilis]